MSPRKKLINRIDKISEKIKKHKNSINNLILLFGMTLFILAGIIVLDNYEVIIISKIIVDTMRKIAIIIASYFIASIFIRLTVYKILKLIKDDHLEEKIITSKTYTFFVYLFATAFVLWYVGVSIQNIALISGLLATGLAFALREVLLSYFVWLILLIKKPFKIGDHIKIGDDEGQVAHIGIFYVVLDKKPKNYNHFIKVPNKVFIEKSIYNYRKKQVPIKISVNINSNSKNIYKKIKELEKEINFVELFKSPYLETINEKLYISLEVISLYDDRNENRTKIIEIILNKFN